MFLVIGLTAAAVLILILLVGRPIQRGAKIRFGSSQARSLYNNAITLHSKGQTEEAIKLLQELVSQFPQQAKAAQAWYKLGEIYENKGMYQKAKAAYAKIIPDFPNFEKIADIEKKVWDLNTKVLFSPEVGDKDFIHKVEPGDTLVKIAAKYNTTVELIMRSNNLPNGFIRPGNRLKISGSKYSVIVDKSQNSLTLRADEQIFKVYPVATGKNSSTPVGTFKIVEKLKNPTWYKQGEGVIPADSPKNILGTRWLGLSEPGYGIHGGATEQDLGKQVTDGCVRMTNASAEELFTILPRNTEVTIVE